MSINAEIALAILAAFAVLAALSLFGVYIAVAMAWDRSPLRIDAGSQARDVGTSSSNGWELTRRALKLRCPACGRGPIFGRHFTMNRRCSGCGAIFWNNEGEWLGPAVVDYSMATASALIAWALTVLFGLSEPVQLLGSFAAAVVGAAVTSRWSRSFWTLLLYISGEMTRPTPGEPAP